MNKRTIILISICCLLAVATLTARYIEQEIEIIKARFVGGKETEERSSRGVSSPRTAVPRTPQPEQKPSSARRNVNMPPVSGGVQSSPARTAPPAGALTRGGVSASAGEKAGSATTSAAQGKQAVKDAVAAVKPATTPVEDVTTPLGPDAGAERQETMPGTERAGGADAREGAAPAADEKKEPAAETDNSGDAAAPAVVEEKSGQAAEESGSDVKSAAEEGAAAAESDEGEDEEVTGEGAAAADEEGVEEAVPAEEEAAPGEGEAAEPAEEGTDEE
jgi:hypothetical protein